MADAVWQFCEERTDVRRADPSTWPTGATPGLGFKKLKRHAAFRAVLAAAPTRQLLDEIYGADEWESTRNGAQILFGFPDTAPEAWRVPSHLWHMDSHFRADVHPPAFLRLFSVVAPLPPRSGATLVLAGTPRLQATYARTAPPEALPGRTETWTTFLRGADPWLARLCDETDGTDGPDGPADVRGIAARNDALARPHVVDGRRVELRELGGEPGDVHVCHANLFHAVAPNAGTGPRIMLVHTVRRRP